MAASEIILRAAGPPAAPSDRLAITLDDSEALAALAILDQENLGREVAAADWQRLFSSAGYTRLHRREAAIGAPFTDDEFKAFLRLPATRHEARALRSTLASWKSVPTSEPAALAFAYLPATARISATVYPMIKPRTNSFVFEVKTDPAIFLYLDAAVPAAKFKNTVAHELHHIGFGTACPPAGEEARWKSLPPAMRSLHDWLGAYGEGFAMLAAAGGADIHPHAASSSEDRARWDHDVANFDQDLATQQHLFLDILAGRLADPQQIDARMMEYFGVQGPWYTVGWRMAVTIEEVFGRQRLIAAECDQDTFLATYNAAALSHNQSSPKKLPTWSAELLHGLEGAPAEPR